MKKRLRSPAVLLVAFAMVIAAAGVAYAHWTSTSRIEANVNVGNMQIGWTGWGTNDDGIVDNDPSLNDNQDMTAAAWDSGNGSSLDPKSSEFPNLRYDKNVANCWIGGDQETLRIDIDSAYPSYHCNIYAEAFNFGSVPAKATALVLTAEKGSDFCTLHEDEGFLLPDLYPLMRGDETGEFVDWLDDGYDPGTGDFYVGNDEFGWFRIDTGARLFDKCVFDGNTITPTTDGNGEFYFSDDLTLHIEEGILCGWQLDPGYHDEGIPVGGIDVSGWIHVENGMEQGVQYRITLAQDWKNWNEFQLSDCG